MKIRLTERELNKIVYEGAKMALREIKMNRIISDTINESLMEYDLMEDSDSDSEKKVHGVSKKRQKVIQFLSSPTVDVAQYAYGLWPEKDKDSCRSYFYKCLNGEKDDNGNEYKFTSDEVNTLYSMISNIQGI